jgi:predicted ABC-type ATPase
MSAPRLIVLAGPNGAGKSTFFAAHLQCLGLDFVNADVLVGTLGISVEEGARAADALRAEYVEARKSFVTETVFSDPVGAKLQFLRDAIAAGYDVALMFIGLSSSALSEARVAHRVAGGGHDVPTEKLARRYAQSLENLVQAMQFVPEVYVFDNSSAEHPHQLILSVRDRTVKIEMQVLPQWATEALCAYGRQFPPSMM